MTLTLGKLIEAVEAGTLPQPIFHGSAAEKGHWAYKTGLNADQRRWVFLAYNGSLDAAHSLQQELLPGWTRSVDATAPDLGIDVDMWPPSKKPCVSATSFNEARAWPAGNLAGERGRSAMNRMLSFALRAAVAFVFLVPNYFAALSFPDGAFAIGVLAGLLLQFLEPKRGKGDQP